jgi:hypothetical protein
MVLPEGRTGLLRSGGSIPHLPQVALVQVAVAGFVDNLNMDDSTGVRVIPMPRGSVRESQVVDSLGCASDLAVATCMVRAIETLVKGRLWT